MENNEDKKFEHVQIKTPGVLVERRDEIKIGKLTAERLIARYLRERLSPAQANEFADRICAGMVAAMSTPVRPALRGYRMIPEYPPYESAERIGGQLRAIRIQEDTRQIARETWAVVYAHGETLPDDMVV